MLDNEQLGARFFQHFLKDPDLYSIFIKEWELFKKSGLNELKAFMSDYVNLLDSSGAYNRDFSRWHKQQSAIKESPRKDLRSYEQDMKKWLDMRVLHIDAFVSGWEKSFELHVYDN